MRGWGNVPSIEGGEVLVEIESRLEGGWRRKRANGEGLIKLQPVFGPREEVRTPLSFQLFKSSPLARRAYTLLQFAARHPPQQAIATAASSIRSQH